jgi:hypothetical protein
MLYFTFTRELIPDKWGKSCIFYKNSTYFKWSIWDISVKWRKFLNGENSRCILKSTPYFAKLFLIEILLAGLGGGTIIPYRLNSRTQRRN